MSNTHTDIIKPDINSKEKKSPLTVYLRIKPSFQKAKNLEIVSKLDPHSHTISLLQPDSTKICHNYKFSHIFDQQASNSNITNKGFSEVTNHLVKGLNVTMMVYGITGSGKSYTMFGKELPSNIKDLNQQQNYEELQLGQCLPKPPLSLSNSSPKKDQNIQISKNTGLIEQILSQVMLLKTEQTNQWSNSKSSKKSKSKTKFNAEREDNSQTKRFTHKIIMSFLEVYNERVRDLINSGLNLAVMEDQNQNTNIVGLKRRELFSMEQLKAILTQGNCIRTTGQTKVNQVSSRSHALIIFYIEKYDNLHKTMRESKLTFVDLAGSERLDQTEAVGQRFVEGSNINRSLLALGNVITKLSSNQKNQEFVPYRDSKLTRILKDSLCGSTKTYMITCISLEQKHYDETIHTLNYASRARMITTSVTKNSFFVLDKDQSILQQHLPNGHQQQQQQQEVQQQFSIYQN